MAFHIISNYHSVQLCPKFSYSQTLQLRLHLDLKFGTSTPQIASLNQRASSHEHIIPAGMGFFRYLSLSTRRSRGDIYTETSALLVCDSEDCPIRERHKPGPYYHKGKALEAEHETWGESNPPPFIWKALDKYQKGRASAAEIQAVVTFQELHSYEWMMYEG